MKLFQEHIKYVPDEKALGLLSGLYRSAFRGRGLEYEDLRQYIPGDDPKILSWAKLAQTGELYSKTFREERDLTVYLVVDPSPSMAWMRSVKLELIMQTVGLLAFSAVTSRDRLGISVGSHNGPVCDFVQAKRAGGIRHAELMIQKICTMLHLTQQFIQKPKEDILSSQKVSLKDCLRPLLGQLKKSGAMVFIVSDFLYTHPEEWSLLSALRQKSDVIAIRILDMWDQNPLSLGEIAVESYDGASQYGPFIHQFHSGCAKDLQNVLLQDQNRAQKELFHRNIDCIDIRETENQVSYDSKSGISTPYVVLRSFFEKRAAKMRRR